MYAKVIVFGPTGNIASIASRTARENGSKVFLAMRNPEKSIPGLSKDDESTGGYERIQADLTQPETVSAAASKSGAKSAFIYVAHGTPDHMKATVQALKAGGVEFVVFLSSFTVQDEPSKIPPHEIIPYAHAQVEVALQEVFGNEFVAIRPGAFATNTLMWKAGLQSGELKIQYPAGKLDNITPDDMGRVSGTVLAKGKQNGEGHVYLLGPQLIAQQDAVAVIAKAIGKEVKVGSMSKEEATQHYTSQGMPPPIAGYLASKFDELEQAGAESSVPRQMFEKEVDNVQKYTGKPGLKFENWVKANPELWTAA